MVFVEKFKKFLDQPLKVLFLSFSLGMGIMLYDGSFWNLWSLHRNYKEMDKRVSAINEENQALQFKVEAAQSKPFIEKQATEQLGLVREDDLIFVFSDGE
jgi:cell division protein FtsB